MHDDYVVAVITKGGIFGDVMRTADKHIADARAAELRVMMKNDPDGRITFNPVGMGFGAPCPVGAIADVVVLPPGAMMPDDVVSAHQPKMEAFYEKLAGAK